MTEPRELNRDGPSVLLDCYLKRRSTLRRLLVVRLGNADDADDVLQELYVKAERTPQDNIREPDSYLFRMAMNLARDYRRASRRGTARDAEWADAHNLMAGFETLADQPSAEDILDAKQRLEALHVALRQLSPQCRRVFELHKLQGLSHQETAAVIGIARSTVEKHMHTALKFLIRRLGGKP